MRYTQSLLEWNKKNILVTGASGFLGSKVVSLLQSKKPKKLFTPRSTEFDLRKRENCVKVLENMNIVFHLAGMGKGIDYIKNHPGSIFFDALMMDIQLMEEAVKSNVEKFISVGTANSYPKLTSIPFHEEDIWSGYPEEINSPFGIAKRMQIIQSKSYRKEYDFNSIVLIISNLYGAGDNFNLETSNVIPAIVRKFYNAKINKVKKVELWGDGSPTRDFIHVKDAARAFILASEKYDKSEPVNIGGGLEVSIKELANKIMKIMELDLTINWNTNKPKGQQRRMLDIKKAQKEFGFRPEIKLDDGLKETINWFINNERENSF